MEMDDSILRWDWAVNYTHDCQLTGHSNTFLNGCQVTNLNFVYATWWIFHFDFIMTLNIKFNKINEWSTNTYNCSEGTDFIKVNLLVACQFGDKQSALWQTDKPRKVLLTHYTGHARWWKTYRLHMAGQWHKHVAGSRVCPRKFKHDTASRTTWTLTYARNPSLYGLATVTQLGLLKIWINRHNNDRLKKGTIYQNFCNKCQLNEVVAK